VLFTSCQPADERPQVGCILLREISQRGAPIVPRGVPHGEDFAGEPHGAALPEPVGHVIVQCAVRPALALPPPRHRRLIDPAQGGELARSAAQPPGPARQPFRQNLRSYLHRDTLHQQRLGPTSNTGVYLRNFSSRILLIQEVNLPSRTEWRQ